MLLLTALSGLVMFSALVAAPAGASKCPNGCAVRVKIEVGKVPSKAAIPSLAAAITPYSHLPELPLARTLRCNEFLVVVTLADGRKIQQPAGGDARTGTCSAEVAVSPRVAVGVQVFHDGKGSASAKHTSAHDTHELEEVSFTFSRIEMDFKDGKKMSQDDWTESRATPTPKP